MVRILPSTEGNFMCLMIWRLQHVPASCSQGAIQNNKKIQALSKEKNLPELENYMEIKHQHNQVSSCSVTLIRDSAGLQTATVLQLAGICKVP